ncbi:hypothetical protein BO71DRAFT_440565 [Aspergillus ellipticus CBS 707.79]|uniref:Uncharacterized protein n=1 Tax=Aspergillus ellipticus CBS 707.79 TaxID=1448320 RepID=A0A319E3A0_9EURO|nr:hypothetical protein BO71DRAFT_440565 [Aspergillus ellipticus CBS 707.79]
MHFSSVTTPLVAALATWTAAAPVELGRRGEMVVGFRRVGKDQAEEYNKKGLYFDHDHVMWGAQIGKGVYTSPSRDEYEKLADPEAWYIAHIGMASKISSLILHRYCVLKADESAFNAIPKTWIPEKNKSSQRLWNQHTEDRIDEYVKSLGEDTATSLRFSIMPHGKDRSRQQMLIPPDLATSKHFSVKCYAKKDDVKDGAVDYAHWNIKGDKGN